MARISIREPFKFRHTIFTHFSLAPPTTTTTRPPPINISPSSSFSSSSSSIFNEDRAISFIESCRNIKQLYQIHAHLVTSGLFFHNLFWKIRILKHYSDFGVVDYTVLVFKCIYNPSTFCINTVLKAYSNSCAPDQAIVFYFQMLKNGLVSNSYTFVPLLGSCAKTGCVESGRICHGLAVKNGVDLVLPVQNSLIHMYGCFGFAESARKMFVEMPMRDLISWNSIVDAYVGSGDLWVAHELFDAMPERNVVSWNIMISGYSKSGDPGCSLKLFREMMKSGFKGSDTTMVSVLTACGRSARLREGRSVHGYIIRTLVKPNMILDTSLIDMYSKCRKVELAKWVFDKMEDKNLISWNAMILGHCIHGKPVAGLQLFAALVDQIGGGGGAKSISPDEITFIGVLCACARAVMLTEGKNYFSQMTHLYKIKPTFPHYWCMANLYAGAGLMEEAEENLRKMPEDDKDLSAESIVWANLLSSCRFQGNVALGERIANTLIEMDPHDFSYYRLLLNVYAVAGRLEDMARVKELVKARRIGRMPGCGLVDLKEIVHKLKLDHFMAEGREEDVNTMINNKCSQKSSLVTAVSMHPPLCEE
ncbi:hypothetical protein Dsin_011396 [Dipteronia sinensis]|uniref:Pentatricopeptide repeat-containing protein n=1 Tax=Dipteronia sinensis TaxID=43782 RepID=A0AAE0AU61_9ROSI|nr:hypothetical protein Dsin_011396 [Dipteronia sinensis]